MNRNIGGTLHYDLLARHHFHSMPHDQQRQAINRLAAAGHTADVISRATGLSPEMVRRLLAEGGGGMRSEPNIRHICRGNRK